jgi:hypothetical protein
MGKVLDQTSAVARSMGWSDQAIRTTREYLDKTSKMQIEMIDRITDGWKQQLNRTHGDPTQLYRPGPRTSGNNVRRCNAGVQSTSAVDVLVAGG